MDKTKTPPIAWLALEQDIGTDANLNDYALVLKLPPSMNQEVKEDDWVLVVNIHRYIARVGRVMRTRSDRDITTFYFDRLLRVHPGISLELPKLAGAASGIIRLQWEHFVEALASALHKTTDEVPGIDDQTYIRELLQLAVTDDLLGPAGGPHERIIDMGVRDRYLVGKLAPREEVRGGIEGLEGPLASEDSEELEDEMRPGQHEPGAEFSTTTGRVEPEADSDDEIDAASNQSLVPSSLGLTFCTDGDVEQIEVEVRWGRYARTDDHQVFKTRKNRKTGAEEQVKAKVWQRIPCGGNLPITLTEGMIPPQAPDNSCPEVCIQGSIRPTNAKGERLVTLFLVNAQKEPRTNRDSAWVFQPEVIVHAPSDAKKKPSFVAAQ